MIAAYFSSLLLLITGWPTYGYSYDNTRSVPFRQINARNVAALAPAWKYETGRYGKFEATPIVVGDAMYLTLPPDDTVVALDAASGKLKWTYTPKLRPVKLCCGAVNRGVAVSGGEVFVATLDARLIALDARSGKPRWQRAVGPPEHGYSETMAPLAWNGMVFIGTSGGDIGMRGSFSAYSASSGKLLWRWWSVSNGWEGRYIGRVYGLSLHRDIRREKALARKYRDAWKKGGGPVWMTPALDAARGTLFLGVGNPWPVVDGEKRPGDNLYTDCVVALDARTGKMHWYYQEVPHDVWDYDAASPPVLLDAIDRSGRRVPAVAEAGKTGFLYVLDRATGALLHRYRGFVPQRNLFPDVSHGRVLGQPTGGDGVVAPIAYDPVARQVYVGAMDQWRVAERTDAYWHVAGQAYPLFTALNLDTGRVRWQLRFDSIGEIDAGINATAGPLYAGGLVFWGEEGTGRFLALDPTNGKAVWQFQTEAGYPTGRDRTLRQKLHDFFAPIKHLLWHELQPQPESHIHNSAIAYVVGGREYIAIGGDSFYRSGSSAGDTLYVFSLAKR